MNLVTNKNKGLGLTIADVEDETWVAIASGFSVGAQEAPADLKCQLLVEWLMGEDGGPLVRNAPSLFLRNQLTKPHQDGESGDRIARLILAGNSLSQPIRGENDKKPVSRVSYLSLGCC